METGMIRLVQMGQPRQQAAATDLGALARQQREADARLAQAVQPRQIEHWTQGANQIAQSALAGMERRRLREKEEFTAKQGAELMSGLLGAGAGGDPANLKAALMNPHTRDMAMKMMMQRRAAAQAASQPSEYDKRAEALKRFGVDPNSPEGRHYGLTGKLPTGAAMKPVVINGRLVNPQTGEVIYESPEGESKPLVVNPGQTVLGRDGQPIYQAEPAPAAPKVPSGYRLKEGGQDGEVEPIPGGPNEKVPFADAAKIAMMENGLSKLDRAEKIVSDMGIGTRAGMALDFGQGYRLQAIVREAVEGILRAMTGAAAPQSEVDSYMALYGPEWNDRPETMKRKLQALREQINGTLNKFGQGRGGRQERQTAPPNNDGWSVTRE